MIGKEKIYVSSLGLGKETEFFGKWVRRNGQFSKLGQDPWQEGTSYWIPSDIREDNTLQMHLIENLVLSEKYKKFELINCQTILLPVTEVGDTIICLSPNGIEKIDNLFSSEELKGYDIWMNGDWKMAEEKTLQKHSSILRPIELSILDVREEVHYKGGEWENPNDRSLNVFFLPVTIFDFKIDGRSYQWLSIIDNHSGVSYMPSLDIEKDKIFTPEYQSKKPAAGCLVGLGLMLVGVWLITVIWSKLQGTTMLLCMVGVVLVLYYLNKVVEAGLIYLMEKRHESSRLKIIGNRKAFLVRKGLKE